MDMTLAEQGAYRNLLDEAHLRGGALPLDDRILAKACGDALEWPKVRAAVLSRFECRADGWHNQTLDDVLAQSVRRAEKQANYRNRGNVVGNESGNNSGNTDGSPDPSPSPSLSPDPSPEPTKTPNGVNSRSRRPIFQGQRFVIFDWMLEDLSRILGPHTDDFDIHSWFFDLDGQAVKTGLVKAKNDWWPWVQAEIMLEAGRRGLPISETGLALSEQGKKNRVAAHAALARIQGGRK